MFLRETVRRSKLLQYVQMSKLTLSVDDEVIAQAKRYAEQNGVSVSSLVEIYLAEVSGLKKRNSSVDSSATPILNSLRGSLRKGDIEDYRRHLEDKYL
jgi:hypothetical protein